MAVNPPLDLKNTALRFKRPINRIYEINFFNNLTKIVDSLITKKVVSKKYEFKTKPKSIIDFDERYTASLLGCKSLYEFYKMCSSAKYLVNSSVPTVILTSKDDPIVDFGDFLASKASLKIIVHAEKGGGHIGYLHKYKTPLGTNRWMDYALNQILNETLKNLA